MWLFPGVMIRPAFWCPSGAEPPGAIGTVSVGTGVDQQGDSEPHPVHALHALPGPPDDEIQQHFTDLGRRCVLSDASSTPPSLH